MIEISQRFSFDAAHHLGAGAAENRRLHGHSFYVEVTLRGEPDAEDRISSGFRGGEMPLLKRCANSWTTAC